MTAEPASTLLYHVALAADWAAARAAGEYRISTLGRTLEEVGFVHASYAAQVGPTLERFYRPVAEPLVLLAIDPERVGCEIRVEEALPGGERFPHLYGPLPVTAVVSAVPVVREPGGGFDPLAL